MSVSYRAVVVCLVAVALAGCSSGTGTGSGGGNGGAGVGGGNAGGGNAGGGAAGGGSGGGGGMIFTDGGGLTPQSSFCTDYVKAYCDRDLNCNYLDQAQYADCSARIQTQCAAAIARITSGLRIYSAEGAFACIGTVKNDACSLPRNFSASTGSAYTYTCLTNLGLPAAMNGSVCVTTGDCKTGFCQTAGINCSACKAFAQAGELCTSSTQCDPKTTTEICPTGFADGGLSDGGSRTCKGKNPDGTPCSDFGASCLSGKCNYNSQLPDAGADVCGFRKIGEACADYEDCVIGAYCKGLDSQNSVPGSCTARIATGGSCTVELEDKSDGCPVTDACLGVGGVCKVSGNQMLNQNCLLNSHCVPSLYCEDSADGGTYGSCLARAAAGSMCSSVVSGPNPLCVAGTTCTGMDAGATCVAPTLPAPKSSLGGTCANTNADCKDLLQCASVPGDAGTCTVYSMAGANCDAGTTVCANGNKSLGFCLSIDAGAGTPALKTCSNTGGTGAGCTNSGQCTSGRCLGGDGGTASLANPGSCLVACIP